MTGNRLRSVFTLIQQLFRLTSALAGSVKYSGIINRRMAWSAPSLGVYCKLRLISPWPIHLRKGF